MTKYTLLKSNVDEESVVVEEADPNTEYCEPLDPHRFDQALEDLAGYLDEVGCETVGDVLEAGTMLGIPRRRTIEFRRRRVERRGLRR
jgi:hypothetical protein